MKHWKLALLITLLFILANMTIHVSAEFEGPLHQSYVDHMRHHQAEVLKQLQPPLKSF